MKVNDDMKVGDGIDPLKIAYQFKVLRGRKMFSYEAKSRIK